MKKYRFLIVVLIAFASFCIGVSGVRALPACNIGDKKHSKGYGSVTQKYTEAQAGQSATIYIDSNSGNSDFSVSSGWKESSWSEKRNFSIYFASKKSGSKAGTIKTFNMTFYDDEGDALCSLTNENWYEDAVGQQYAIFNFDITSGHISKIEASGTYEYDGKPQNFDTKKFHIGKKKGNTGSVSNTTTTKKTSKGETTTTSTKRTVEDATPGKDKTADVLYGNKKNGVTDKDGNISFSDTDSCDKVHEIIYKYWQYIMIIVPVLLILMLTIDFFKAMISNDSEAIKKSVNNTVKRTISAVVLLALPVLLGFIFSLFGIEVCF